MSIATRYLPPEFYRSACQNTNQEYHIWDPFVHLCKIEEEIQEVETNDVKDSALYCLDIAEDIFLNLRLEEVKNRPQTTYMYTVQKNIISPTTRADCVNMLVFTSEQLKYATNTLYLAVNYLDRFLSVSQVEEKSLGFISLSCLMIASKYEEVSSCGGVDFQSYFIATNGVYWPDDFIHMERTILKYLGYNLTVPTISSFLEMFLIRGGKDEVSGLKSMANFISELSLGSYDMLQFLPSLIAASSVFLARFILLYPKRPWNASLQHYTQYKPSDLRDCVLELHAILYDESGCFDLPDIRLKYCQQRFHFVSLTRVPSSIPLEVFEN